MTYKKEKDKRNQAINYNATQKYVGMFPAFV